MNYVEALLNMTELTSSMFTSCNHHAEDPIHDMTVDSNRKLHIFKYERERKITETTER